MKYLFFGTPEFAAIILGKLIGAGFPPAGVVCNPDRPVGRKKIVTPPPTKIIGEKNGIPVLQPERLSDLKIKNLELKIGKIDFAIVAAYSKIIPGDILKSFELGVLGVHPSLLPKYRGATPIQSVILAGENKTGVTLYAMDEKVDHGPILAQRELEFSIFPPKADPPPADNFQFSILQEKLADLAGAMLVETIPKFMEGKIKSEAQNENQATYTKKFITEDARVDPEDLNEAQNGVSLAKAEAIERKIRALNPEPGVFTLSPSKGGPRRMKILEAEIRDGKLILKNVQYEGEKPKRIN